MSAKGIVTATGNLAIDVVKAPVRYSLIGVGIAIAFVGDLGLAVGAIVKTAGESLTNTGRNVNFTRAKAFVERAGNEAEAMAMRRGKAKTEVVQPEVQTVVEPVPAPAPVPTPA